MKPAIDSGMAKGSSSMTNRVTPLNSTMYTNRNSAKIEMNKSTNFGKFRRKRRRNLFSSNPPR